MDYVLFELATSVKNNDSTSYLQCVGCRCLLWSLCFEGKGCLVSIIDCDNILIH